METTLFYWTSFIISIIACTTGLFFSFLILFIVATHQTCRNATNMLICNTCVVLSTYFFNTIIVSIYGFHEDWAMNQPLCQFRAYCFLVSCGLICYSYLIIAISRLFFTVYYQNPNLLTYRTHVYLIIFNWILGIVLAIEPWMFDGGYIYESESRLCTFTTKKFHTAFFGVSAVFLTPLSIALIIYVIIFIKTQQSTRRIVAASNDLTRTNTINVKREMKLIRNMVILMAIFAAGGTPFLILVLWHGFLPNNPPPESFYLLNINAISFFVAAMVIALFLMNKQFKDAVRQRLQ